MSSRLDQEKEQLLQPKRMEVAVLALQKLGYKITHQSDTELQFVYNEAVVRFYPYSGWHTGRSIRDGRGLQELLNQIK